jgi:hypothetical protein
MSTAGIVTQAMLDHHLAAAQIRGLGTGSSPCNRLSVREPQHLVLGRPRKVRIDQAGNADPVRQSTFGVGSDKTRRKGGEGDRHIDVALAAALAIGNALDGRGASLDLG